MSGRKAIFLDIDGTLIAGDRGPFKDDLEAMEEAAGKGHFLFLNTGRSFANIPAAMLELSAVKGIAAGGGAHVLLAGTSGRNLHKAIHPRYKTIYHRWFPEKLLVKIFTWYGNQSRCCILEGEQGFYIINHSSRLYTTKAPVPVSSLDEFKRKSSGDLITKLTLDDHVSEEEQLLLEPFVEVTRFTDYSEGIIKGENKAKAMKIIFDNLKIRQEDSIAIGDSANDMDMIRFAGLGIAMGNACAELRSAAGAITEDCGKGGVARALRKFILS